MTVPGDGEYGKAMGHKVNYGAWWSYSFSRLSGLDPNGPGLYEMPPVRSKPGEIHLTSFADRRDRLRFLAAYNDRTSGVAAGRGGITWPRCVGPVAYIGQDAIAADIAHFKAALAAANVSEGFMTSVGPASASRVANEHYKTEEEFIWACADAMREEYQAIIDAGLVLQIDDPFVAEAWDQINPEPSVEDYQRFVMTAVEALNHALRGLADRAHPLPPVLGQLARPALDRHRDEGHRRRHARHQRGRLLVRGGERRGTSTSGSCGRTRSCPTAR